MWKNSFEIKNSLDSRRFENPNSLELIEKCNNILWNSSYW